MRRDRGGRRNLRIVMPRGGSERVPCWDEILPPVHYPGPQLKPRLRQAALAFGLFLALLVRVLIRPEPPPRPAPGLQERLLLP